MGNLRLDYEVLKADNPGVILCSLSAYGHDGPWANVPGIGGTIEPTSGMSALLGYEGGPPMNSGQMYPDPVAGYYGAASILAALHHRDRTGEGQFIDLSMQEANLTFVGDAALEFLRNGTQRPRMGNRNANMVPHGIYPCDRPDEWVAIAVGNDVEFAALATLAGIETDASFLTKAGRRTHEQELDTAIACWTRTQPREVALLRLDRAGVPAAPVFSGVDIANDPLVRERGMLVDVSHPEAGVFTQLGEPVRFSRSAPVQVRHAPLLGSNSFEVFSERLGMTESEFAVLVRDGVTGEGPP